MWQWLCMLRSSIPGKVISFDSDAQTCVVQIAIQETILKPPPGAKNSTQNIPTIVSIDPLEDVPIFMMRTPGWSITFPIIPGTECLLIFSDACIDGWLQTGAVSPQYDRRRHDLSDAVALFGPWSHPNKLVGYSNSSVQIRSDDKLTLIDLSSIGISIKSPMSVSVEAPSVNLSGASVNISSPSLNLSSSGAIGIVAPNIVLAAPGTAPSPLLTDAFYHWFTTVYMPSVSYVTVAPALPISPETSTVKGY